MMGKETSQPGKLFYSSINLEERIRHDHILRKIKKHIDFDFIYTEVKDQYGPNGNISVPPPVILKMMLLLIIYNVRSERELMDTIPERLDWLWFLGYEIDNEIPNHSILSKARNRWGVEVFRHLFERIVRQCVEAGLVAGKKLFMDSSLVQANASNNSVIKPEKLKKYLEKGYKILESRLEEKGKEETNETWKSKTDPDASIVRRGGIKAKLGYQVHRGVDGKEEIITSSEVAPGEINEAHKLQDLVEQHEKNTGMKTG
ncbi:MAG: transposase, partial [bacterium]|nr:transposase [bacterium]